VSRLRKLRRDSDADADFDALPGAALQGRLRAAHAGLVAGAGRAPGAGGWAQAGGDDGDGDGDDDGDGADEDVLLRRAGSARAAGAGGALPAGHLSVTRVRDGNRCEPSRAVVQAACFHPSAPVLLTAGLDKKLRFFAIDGKDNAKVASVHFPGALCGGRVALGVEPRLAAP
jgi:U3 small nucleolar RNA-associated protein 18